MLNFLFAHRSLLLVELGLGFEPACLLLGQGGFVLGPGGFALGFGGLVAVETGVFTLGVQLGGPHCVTGTVAARDDGDRGDHQQYDDDDHDYCGCGHALLRFGCARTGTRVSRRSIPEQPQSSSDSFSPPSEESSDPDGSAVPPA